MTVKSAYITGFLVVMMVQGVVLAVSPDLGVIYPQDVRGLSSGYVPDEILVKFKENVIAQTRQEIHRRYDSESLRSGRSRHFERVRRSAQHTLDSLLDSYQRDPNVEYAEKNYYAHAYFVPNDTYFSYQWHFDNAVNGGIHLKSAWDIQTGIPSVIVAVIDTGVAYETYGGFIKASDLAATSFVAGYNFVANTTHANDDNGHGTHVTGTIAQSTNNSKGVAGIAFHCTVMPVKALDSTGSGSYADIADAIYFATDHGAQVINMSLGGTFDSITLYNAVVYAYLHGVTVVCAAGNDYQNGNPPSFPAAYHPYCIAVGATRFDQTRAYYSNTGDYVDLVAPGGDLNVDQNHDGYRDGVLQQTFNLDPTTFAYYFMMGTSMATPHVSGVSALLISQGVIGPTRVCQALQHSALDLGAPGWDPQYGWGLLDAQAALTYVPGDLNGDYHVNGADLVIFMGQWLSQEPPRLTADFNDDAIVDFEDFVLLADYWGW